MVDSLGATGGFIAALVLWAVHALFRVDIGFDMTTRDKLLVIFFVTVGVNARLKALAAGSRVLGILCPVTAAFVFLQDTVGTIGAVALGLPKAAGVVVGSMSLVGGHGTAIALGTGYRRGARLPGGAGERHRGCDDQPHHR